MEFSKKILMWTFIIALVIIGYAMWIQYIIITKDFHGGTEVITALIVGVSAEVTAGVSFYYWKSKAENLLKIKQSHGEEVVEEIKNEIGE